MLTIGTIVTLNRAIPRLNIQAGTKARIVAIRGNGLFEISFYSPAVLDMVGLVVYSDWISEDAQEKALS